MGTMGTNCASTAVSTKASKYLVFLIEHLSFKIHIQNIVKKLKLKLAFNFGNKFTVSVKHF